MRTIFFCILFGVLFILLFGRPSSVRSRLCAIFALALWGGVAHAADLQVPSQYSGIQFAIDAAVDGDRVLVSPGVYSGNANTNLDFRGKSISVIGITGRLSCIIDCKGIGRALNFHSNEKSGALFKGFTVRNGSATQGGGLIIENSSPSITNCAFADCHSDVGGAICVLSGSPSIRVCDISGNDATSGGGVAVLAGHPSILATAFSTNHAAGFGGAIALLGGSLDVHRSRLLNNDATSFGGAVYVGGSSLTFAEDYVQENVASVGGGLYLEANSTVSILNSTLVVNRATNDAGGIFVQRGCAASMVNSIVARNNPSQMSAGMQVTTSFVEGGYSGQAVDQAPSIQDLTSLDGHLRFGSGVDAGSRSGVTLETVDLDGNTRVVGLAPDLGAFEYSYVNSSASADITVTVPHDGDPATDTMQVNMVGTANDPTGQPMNYDWLEDGIHIATGQNLQMTLKAGSYDFTFKATDSNGNFTTNNTHVVVNPEPNHPPTVTAAIATQVRTGPTSATVTLQATASDPDHDPVTVLWSDGSTDLTHVVDLNVGSYDYTVTVTDPYGATARSYVRVQVDPIQGPLISLAGLNPMHVEAGGTFVDPGAVAYDSNSNARLAVTVTGSVDPMTLGSYVLSYTASSPDSATTTITRTVNVTDTVLPVVTLVGAATMVVPPNSFFSDPGATAADSFAGVLPVTVTGTVDTTKHATFVLTYTASDPSGNIGKAVRNVRVANTANPVVTLNGANPIYVQIGTAFIDPGATALSQGNESLAVSVSGTVDTITLGTYTLTYSATDADGNTGSTTRTVIVWDKVAPVITILGSNPLSIQVQLAQYVDPGATALDAVDGPVPVSISGSVDTHSIGTYTITYTATDNSGNQATATRTVNVTRPTTPPVITVLGSNPALVYKGTTYVDAGATAVDLLGNSVTVVTSGTVNTSAYGTYTLTYSAIDQWGNAAATKTRTVNVEGPPVITLLGANPYTVVYKNQYNMSIDPGATAVDYLGNTLTVVYDPTTINTHTPGTQYEAYTATDQWGNVTTVTRTLIILAPTTPPIVTLNGVNPMNVAYKGTFVDPGATATDFLGSPLNCVVNGNVNTNQVGTYTITYKATDGFGNSFSTTRTVNVMAPPVVTLNGSTPMSVVIGSTFTDPGATALDWLNASLTVTKTGSVNTATAGTYSLTYSATDSVGQTSTANRSVVVSTPTTPPTITVLGTNPMTVAWNSSYSDAGATAKDVLNNNVAVTNTGSVNTATPGTYTLTYHATDQWSNSATKTRTVTVSGPTTPPTITVLGSNPVTVAWNSTYSDAGATAKDAVNNAVTVSTSGLVNTLVPGTYTLTYNATDQWGNVATAKTRTINVSNPTTPPTITVSGTNPLTVAYGSVYTDAGATAKDALNNTVAVSASGSVNISVPGTYTISYNATDQWGNVATTKTRTVTVAGPTTPPTITLLGSDPMTVYKKTTFTDPGATALDALGNTVTVSSSNNVNMNKDGSYTVTYTATDQWGNTATKTRTVNVVTPTTPPTVTVLGTNPLTVVWSSAYIDAGATAVDVSGASVTVTTTNPVNTATPGTYTVSYSATDQWGNVGTGSRTVTVSGPTTPPTITVTGTNPITVAWNSVYTDAGATAKDALNNTVTVTTTGSVTTATPGTYTLTYHATDQWGNVATTKTRTVTVSNPTTPPTITVTGTNPLTVAWNSVYSDAGATAVDAMGNSVTVTTTGSVTTATPGTYTLTYHATDQWGNVATTKTRTVTVSNPTTPPTITVTGSNPAIVVKGATYTDAGATAVDAMGNSVTVTTSGSVNTSVAGTYTLTYNATDQWGNVAASKTRTVNVYGPPVITLVGANPQNIAHSNSTTWTDPGSSAVDSFGVSLTVTVTGGGFKEKVGTYIVTYSATDAAGNTTTVTRTVNCT